MARLPDPVPHLRGADRELYEAMLARRREHGVGLYGPYVPLLHAPQLADRVERLGGYLKYEGSLPRDRYQFVVLAFAHRVGGTFEWQDHVGPARAAGVPEAVIEALQQDGPMPDPYAALAAAVAGAVDYGDLAQDVQDRIVADVGTEGLVEVIVNCGLYALMAMVTAAFDVPLDEAGRSRAPS